VSNANPNAAQTAGSNGLRSKTGWTVAIAAPSLVCLAGGSTRCLSATGALHSGSLPVMFLRYRKPRGMSVRFPTHAQIRDASTPASRARPSPIEVISRAAPSGRKRPQLPDDLILDGGNFVRGTLGTAHRVRAPRSVHEGHADRAPRPDKNVVNLRLDRQPPSGARSRGSGRYQKRRCREAGGAAGAIVAGSIQSQAELDSNGGATMASSPKCVAIRTAPAPPARSPLRGADPATPCRRILARGAAHS
jgi:hypothetical protein